MLRQRQKSWLGLRRDRNGNATVNKPFPFHSFHPANHLPMALICESSLKKYLTNEDLDDRGGGDRNGGKGRYSSPSQVDTNRLPTQWWIYRCSFPLWPLYTYPFDRLASPNRRRDVPNEVPMLMHAYLNPIAQSRFGRFSKKKYTFKHLRTYMQ